MTSLPNAVLSALLALAADSQVLPASEVKADETVALYPTIAGLSDVGSNWQLKIEGRVFQRERRTWTLAALRQSLDLTDVEMTPEATAIFNERARAFLEDNERGKVVKLRVRSHTFASTKTGADGRFAARFSLPGTETVGTATVDVEALAADDRGLARGEVHLLSRHGWSVITDVDDTIKITEVTNKQALLRNTFLRPYQAVPGMAALYRSWATHAGAQFHYVSASPWQLYEPIAAMVRSNGFPAGSFHLKPFRVKDRSFFDLFASPQAYKREVIGPILEQFPQRQFVLVGDSGEQDPEIYGRLAREHPSQVRLILIRNVTGEATNSARMASAFWGVPAAKWSLFTDPAAVPRVLPAVKTAGP